MRDSMNLHALRIFTKVAQLGSITAAANELLISQPAVTIQIRNLEKEMNVKLVEGKGRGIRLTSEGHFIYEQGLRLFQLEQQIEENIKVFLSKEEKIKLASSYIPVNYILPRYIASYKLTRQCVEFDISLGNVKSVEEKVLNYTADFGLVVQSNVGHHDLNFERLMEIEFLFVVHPTHPLANKQIELRQLSAEEVIYREQGSSTRDLLEAVFYANDCPLPKKGLQMQGLHESIKAVEAGYGLTLAPNFSVEESLKQQKLAVISIQGITMKQSLYICTRKSDTFQNAFIAYVKEQIQKECSQKEKPKSI